MFELPVEPNDIRSDSTTEEDGRRTIQAETNTGDEWVRQMDAAVAEVFQRMLERSCAAVEEGSAIGTDISAMITFSGSLTVQCAVALPSSSAEMLTSAFLGSGEAGWDDTMVADAVGELCNMIAGGWKQRLGAPAWGSDLSVPSISRGPDRNPKEAGSMRMRRTYAFDESPFVVRLIMR